MQPHGQAGPAELLPRGTSRLGCVRPVRPPHWNPQVLDRSLPDQEPAQKLELRELVPCLPMCQVAAGDTRPAAEGRPHAGQDGAPAGRGALTLC